MEIGHMDILREIVQDCFQAGRGLKIREETVWLNQKYQIFMEHNGYVRKSDADQELCFRIFGRKNCSLADTQKLRYWRSGKHMPNDRGIVERLGIALDLDEEDQVYLMKGWFDRCDRCFSEKQTSTLTHKTRRALMQELVREYLQKCRWRETDYITQKKAEYNFRYYYYTDSLMCVSGTRQEAEKDSYYRSVYYQSELMRNIRLLGEIPRKTMIRHLFLLLSPFISRKILDERLEALGYLPLKEEHSMVTGERLDLLLIRLLSYYEDSCRGGEPGTCRKWLESVLTETDRLLAEHGQERLRFMKYKGLGLEQTKKRERI